MRLFYLPEADFLLSFIAIVLQYITLEDGDSLVLSLVPNDAMHDCSGNIWSTSWVLGMEGRDLLDKINPIMQRISIVMNDFYVKSCCYMHFHVETHKAVYSNVYENIVTHSSSCKAISFIKTYPMKLVVNKELLDFFAVPGI